ncbi:hypothetical protein Tco_0441367 [Tanacetum coccineum]
MYLTSSRPDIMFPVCTCARYQVNPKVSHIHAVKRIFRYLKGQPKLGLWYPKDSPFDLTAYTDSDYARASPDRKFTTRGCQFLGCRLISWQCKKQTVIDFMAGKKANCGSNSTTRLNTELHEVDVANDPTNIADEAVNEEPIMQLKELMDFCTKLQQRVLDLENTKTAQAQEITSLKKRVKKLEKKGGSRTHKLKRLYKVGRSARVVSSEEASLVSALTITNVELTLAQTLAELKSTRPKIKGVVMQKPSESTPTISLQLPSHVKGQGSKVKGKAKVIDPEKPLKKKDQIKFDEKEAFRLQAKFDEEDRLAKEKAELLGISQHCLEVMEESSSKRAGDELEQENAKKQKVDDDQEAAKMKELMKIVPNEEKVVDAIPFKHDL